MNVIITGASRGIGYALAKKFSKEKDTTLYLFSRTKEKLRQLEEMCREINPEVKVHSISADLMELQVNLFINLFNSVHIDILINNAGLLINKPFTEFEYKELLKLTETNFFVPVKLISGLFSNMGGVKPTHVVNIGSMGGVQGSVKFPGLSIYSASKAALATLTECLAAEYPDKNIYFNCLALGAVQTEMFDEAFPGYKAPLTADEAAEFITDFALNGYKYFNGKIIPVSLSIP